MKAKSILASLLLLSMLSWGSAASAQSQDVKPASQGSFISKLNAMLSQMTDEQKAFARANWLVAPVEYTSTNSHPPAFMVLPNPAPDTQQTFECAGCSSAYLLRFYGADADGVKLFHQPDFPCKHDEGAFPRCFKVLFEEQYGGYTTDYFTGTTDDLKDAVSQGIPAIVLLFSPRGLHYVPVVGYDETHFYIQDSVEDYRNAPGNKDYNRVVDIPTFDKLWNIPLESCQRLFVIVKRATSGSPKGEMEGALSCSLFTLNCSLLTGSSLRPAWWQ